MQVESTPPVVKVRVKQAAHREKKKKKKVVEDVDVVGGGSSRLLDIYMSKDFTFFMSLSAVDDLMVSSQNFTFILINVLLCSYSFLLSYQVSTGFW